MYLNIITQLFLIVIITQLLIVIFTQLQIVIIQINTACHNQTLHWWKLYQL